MVTGQHKCNRKLCQTRSKETHEALMAAGIKLFALHGFYKVNTKEIAKEAGVAIGSFYGYYEDKKQLFMALVQTYKEALLAAGKCESTSQQCTYSVEDVIQYFINRRLQVSEQYPLAFLMEIQYVRSREPEIAEVYDFYFEQELDLFMAYMQHHVEGLRVTDLRLAARLIYQLNENMINAYLATEDHFAKEDVVSAYKDMVSRYLFVD